MLVNSIVRYDVQYNQHSYSTMVYQIHEDTISKNKGQKLYCTTGDTINMVYARELLARNTPRDDESFNKLGKLIRDTRARIVC